ncbi:hypothetical protein SALWKB2_0723 [Snodgrassella alvi wkB2]|nr:hypothetical protein SALWKB2_0723 [Snodgrassella alvi wkB2]
MALVTAASISVSLKTIDKAFPKFYRNFFTENAYYAISFVPT